MSVWVKPFNTGLKIYFSSFSYPLTLRIINFKFSLTFATFTLQREIPALMRQTDLVKIAQLLIGISLSDRLEKCFQGKSE
jgi:hypothetical protein